MTFEGNDRDPMCDSNLGFLGRLSSLNPEVDCILAAIAPTQAQRDEASGSPAVEVNLDRCRPNAQTYGPA